MVAMASLDLCSSFGDITDNQVQVDKPIAAECVGFDARVRIVARSIVI